MSTNPKASDLRAQLRSETESHPIARALLVLERILITALRSMGRNLLLTITTVLIMASMLGSILLLQTAGALGAHAGAEVAKRITISLEVRESTSPSDIDSLRQALSRFPHVTQVQYVTKDQAKRELEQLGLVVPDFIGDNPFADRLRIQTDDLDARTSILDYITTSRFKDLVVITERERTGSSYEQKVSGINQVIANVERIGLALVTLFAIISCLVIIVTVRLTIHTRRDELAIMQLVGASRTSIIGPFVLEAVFDAALAAALALAFFGPVIEQVFPGLDQFFQGFGIQQYLASELPSLLLLILGIGAALGAVASFVSTAWYLRKQPVL